MAGFMELYKAVESNNTHEVCRLVRDGININIRDSMKRTVLHHAAEYKSKKMAELLVRLGARVNARDIQRKTPLHYVVSDESLSYTQNRLQRDDLFKTIIRLSPPEERQHITCIMQRRIIKETTEMIDCLHHLGADLNASFDEVTSLDEAVRLKNITAINVLTSLGVDVNVLKAKGLRAISRVMWWIEVLKHLVHLGADITFGYKYVGALHDAVEMGRLDIVEILIKHGGDVNAAKWSNINIVCLAIITNIRNVEVYKCLAQLGADLNWTCTSEQVLREAVKLKEAEISKYLVQHGAIILLCGKGSLTPIGLAAVRFKYKILACLVHCGADINHRYDLAVPVLIDAVREGNTELVMSLIGLGVKVDDTYVIEGIDAIGMCAVLGLMLTSGLPEMLQGLQENVNYGYDPRVPALQSAATPGHVMTQMFGMLEAGMNIDKIASMVKHLLKLGANVNSCCEPWIPLVHDVVARNNVKMFQVLGELGANMNITKSEGFTILNVVLQWKSEGDIVELLIKKGADANTRYNDQVSPLHHAMRLSNTQMVQSLIKFGANINNNCLRAGLTSLNEVVAQGKTTTVNMFLKYGADIHVKCDGDVAPIHVAVARGDVKMIKVLCHLGANLNIKRFEGLTVIGAALLYKSGIQKDTIRALVAAGADLNVGFNMNVTALHDAVKSSNPMIVETLAHLSPNMNMNSRKYEGIKALHLATTLGLQDTIECFAELGADMNVGYEDRVMPLHDAIRLGNTKMVKCLVKNGANVQAGKLSGLPPMHIATCAGDTDMMKILVKAGADINITYSRDISALYIAHQLVNKEVMIEICECFAFKDFFQKKVEKVPLLQACLVKGDIESFECLLSLGINVNRKQYIPVSLMDDSISYLEKIIGIRECSLIDQIGLSPLHMVCVYGNTDLARLLIIAGSDFNMMDHHNKKPLEMLPLASTGTIDYHVLHEATTTEKVIENVGHGFQSVVHCQNIESIHSTPGLGNVQYIIAPNFSDISEPIHRFLQIMINRCKLFSKAKLKGCGSANEGTRVGLPNEMDFLFELDPVTLDERNIINAGYGYVNFVNASSQLGQQGSKRFHDTFATEVSEAISYLRYIKAVEKVTPMMFQAPVIKDSNRKACSPLIILWGDEFLKLIVSVDTVPCLHVDNWPEGAINNTWLMDAHALRQKGYLLVPKPPHVKSDLAKQYSTKELQALWRISFAHLETEHMQRLEKRVKDVYVVTKILRNPDVCRIMVTDERSLPKNVDRYITSYHLKMMFLKNVETFLNSDQSLGAMVCKVYDDLEEGLSEEYIPLFFMPSVNILDGLKLNVPKCAKVAKIMKRFVHALYLRDCQEDTTDSDVDEEVIVYQRKPRTAYRSIEISP